MEIVALRDIHAEEEVSKWSSASAGKQLTD
jgi:hypothetical protein